MCVIPIGGFQNILIPPTEKAVKLADYLRVAISLHFVMTIMLFLCGRWLDGALDLIGVAIGYLSIRNPDGYSIQQVLCYTFYCGMDFFWALIRMIMFFAGTSAESVPDPNWQFYIYVSAIVAGPLVYLLATIIGYYLYNELKNIINEMQAAFDGGMGGPPPDMYSSYAAPPQQQQQQPSSNIWAHSPSHPESRSGAASTPSSSSSSVQASSASSGPASAASGFKPFTGTGNRLGGR